MPTTPFNRDTLAAWYARQHQETDPGIVAIYHLPRGADEREIRLIEVNKLIGERNEDSLQPIDFGIDAGMPTAHRLLVLDVTPEQWQRIQLGQMRLPGSWVLEGACELGKASRRKKALQ